MLRTEDGATWYLRPGRPWSRWTGVAWIAAKPPHDPGLRAGARVLTQGPDDSAQPRWRAVRPRGQPSHLTAAPTARSTIRPQRKQERTTRKDVDPVGSQATQKVRPAQHFAVETLPGGVPLLSGRESANAFIGRTFRMISWAHKLRKDGNRQGQPNPIVLLVGAPNSGQRRTAEALRTRLVEGEVLADRPLVEDDASEILEVARIDEHPAGFTLRRCLREAQRKEAVVHLVEHADELFDSGDACGVVSLLTEVAHDQHNAGVLVLAGTEAFLERLLREARPVAQSGVVHRLADLSDEQARAALLDLLARDRDVELTDEARSALVALSCSDGGSGARAVEAVLSGAVRESIGRGAGVPDEPVRVEIADVEAVRATGRVDDQHRRRLPDLLSELDGLVGLDEVKAQVRALVSELEIDAQRRRAGLKVVERSRHLVFTGHPGTAKTTVARLLAEIYRELGVLSSGHLVECQRADLVGEYVGETASKTRKVVRSALGGVLFLDEAYALVSGNSEDFGPEAITELVAQMENHRGELVVIAAGYPREMEGFLDVNPGLRSRFAARIRFADYSNDQLAQIFARTAEDQGYELDPELARGLPSRMARVGRGKGFANGRSARALLEKAVSRQATRLAEHGGQVGADELRLLRAEDLPEDSGVGPAGSGAPRRPLPDLLSELDGLVGLEQVKERVRALTSELRLDARRREAGLPVAVRSRHLVFTGNPGTAKTTVARLLAQIYRELGVLTSGHLVEVTRSDLVGEYVGHTAPKTRAVVDEAAGGVLFIDEAHALAPGGGPDFGVEAVSELLVHMEERRDDLVVIAAGYPGDMERFLRANPGLRSRFGTTVDFPDYTDEQLAHIFGFQAENKGYRLGADLLRALPGAIAALDRGPGFANGRTVRGLLERAVERQSLRLAAPGTDLDTVTDEELQVLTAPDLG
jgi:SpoVK/Ycf46/Vps4 family AAA+-type ATPase